jgi:hypothetical protein
MAATRAAATAEVGSGVGTRVSGTSVGASVGTIVVGTSVEPALDPSVLKLVHRYCRHCPRNLPVPHNPPKTATRRTTIEIN